MKTHRINLRDWESDGLLDGRITALCRVVRPDKKWLAHSILRPDMAAHDHQVWWHYPDTDRVGHLQDSPFGAIGDVVLGRECWRYVSINHTIPLGRFITIQFRNFSVLPWMKNWKERYAHVDATEAWREGQTGMGFGRWRSSVTQPDWAIRHRLTTKSVRCVRVWDVKPSDALKLGFEYADDTARWLFAEQFDRDNPRDPWADNPWVWVGEVGLD